MAVLGLEFLVGPAADRIRHGAELTEITIDSDAVGEELPTQVVVPSGADDGPPRPLLVFLHGRSSNGDRSNLDEEMYAALADQGKRGPIVAFPNGGEHSYWHDRADGDWAGYVIDEVIPRVVDEFGADPNRVAVGGISMGGFGSLDLARVSPQSFCAVGSHSGALWREGGDTAPGAFDDAADFERHDVMESGATAADPYLGKPVWLDTGTEDSFRQTIEEFGADLAAAGADVRLHVWPGGHEGAYWRSHWDDYMRFYGTALADC